MSALPIARFRRRRLGRALVASGSFILAGTLASPALGAVAPAPIVAWGQGNNGQFGLGNNQDQGSPVPVPAIEDASATAAGSSFGLVLRSGVVFGTGLNTDGQLGRGGFTGYNTFAPVVGVTTPVRAISAGRSFSLLLLADGTVSTFGANNRGQLGRVTEEARSVLPGPVPGLANAIAVSGGWEHAVALLADGTVRAWGANGANELGDGTGTPSSVPVTVPGVSGIVAVAAGEHTLALRRDGKVVAWGRNDYGQLGLGDTAARSTPTVVPGIDDAVAVAAGRWHSLVLLADGTVRAFGSNNAARLGDGSTENRSSPVRVVGLRNVVEIGGLLAGGSARRADGTVWAWGNGNFGQLGDGNTAAHNSPVPVPVGGVRVQALSPGSAAAFQLPILHVPVAADGPLRFGVQARETLSAPRAVALTVGTGEITRVRTVGPDADDFLISGDDCVGPGTAAGDRCTVRVRFAPAAPGPRSARLVVSSTTAGDVTVELDGEGGELVAGPKGDAGDPGRVGAQGPVGPLGPEGPRAGVDAPPTTPVGAAERTTVSCRRTSAGTRIRCVVRTTSTGRVRVTGRVSGVRKSMTRSGRSQLTLTLAAPRRAVRPRVTISVVGERGRRAVIRLRVGTRKSAALRS